MKIKFLRDENGVSALIVREDTKEEKLTNLKLIDEIYNGNELETEFDPSVSGEEKAKIEALLKSLVSLKNPKEDTKEEQAETNDAC